MITRLMLVNARSGADLRPLAEAEAVILSVDGDSLNIRAEVSMKTGSVGFDLTPVGSDKLFKYTTENVAPYYLAGDALGRPRGWTPPIGVWRLKVTPYSGTNRGGMTGISVFVTLTVLAKPAEEARPTNYVSPPLRFPTNIGVSGWPFRVDPYTIGTPRNDSGDYWSDSGQIAYDADAANDPGLGAVATFAYTDGVFATQPRWDVPQYRGIPNPDPSTRSSAYIAANGGPLLRCISQVRSTNTTGNCAFVLWENGLLTIAATQTGHGNIPWPVLKLPANKRVVDLAITSNNELALIACVDTDTNKGQIAVVMVEGRGDINPTKGTALETFAQMGLFNQASLSAFKLLGYVDLPINAPTKISAASNGHWSGPSETNGTPLGRIDLNSASNLQNLWSGSWQGVVSANGYAVVLSQTEGKAVLVDLSPLFLYVRQSWLSSVTSFQATTAAYLAGIWPNTFEELPWIQPTVAKVFDLPEPVSVLCGHYVDRWSHDRFKFHVGLASGDVAIFDASPIMARFSWQVKGAAVVELGRFHVGSSPVGLCFSRHQEGKGNPIFGTDVNQQGDGQNSVLWVACDKEQKVVEILTFGGKGTILRILQDARMAEPVDVCVCQRNYTVLVCDYAGKQLIGWRIGNLTDNRITPAVVYPPGQVEGYEISGFLAIPGKPKRVTSSNVN